MLKEEMKMDAIHLNETTQLEIFDVKHRSFAYEFGHTMLSLTFEREGKDDTRRTMKLVDFIALLQTKYGLPIDEESLVDAANNALDLFRHAVKEEVMCAIESARAGAEITA